MTRRAGPRKAAQLAGEKRYFTGQPCVHGHVADRFVSTKACTKCANQASHKWGRERALKNPGLVSSLRKQYYAENHEKARGWYRTSYVRNQGKYYAAAKLRKISQKKRTPEWADLRAIQAVYVEARRRRDAGESVVVDHSIPLNGEAVSGLHVHTNLQIIDVIANREKSNKFQECF